jgi:phosphatidylserine/phosphatidylglycerophosphate/cardiolipin synthase-like enzyme
MLKAHGLDEKNLRASTVHGFQGDQRTLLVLDLVDSVGERNAGFFLQAEQLRDSGAKLFNVALSRAQEAILVVANLTFLDAKLPGNAILRGLLHDLQRGGRIIDVRDVLSLYPILEDLKRFGPQPELDLEALRTGLFGGRDFTRLVKLDLTSATKSIVIFSGFVTPARTAAMGNLLRQKIAQGVRVRCVTRPPRYNGSIPEEIGREALKSLEAIGAAVDLRRTIHEKVVLIDDRIAWFGSLNPLSHTAHTSEIMARVENEEVTDQIARMLSARRRSNDDLQSAARGLAENPRCEKCGGWTVLYRSKFGLFFKCESGCDWKQDANRPVRRRV